MTVCIKQCFGILFSLSSFLILPSASALDVNISPDIEKVEAVHEGQVVDIQRIQNQNNVLTGGYTKTSRKCPPFCVQPMEVAPGVTTVGELELLEFIEKKVKRNRKKRF